MALFFIKIYNMDFKPEQLRDYKRDDQLMSKTAWISDGEIVVEISG